MSGGSDLRKRHNSRLRLRRFAAVVCLALVGLVGTSAHAEDDSALEENKQKADALFTAGLQLYQDGKYKEALPLFEQAYDLYPSPVLVMNIGSTLGELGRIAEAANTYERFLRLPGRNRDRDKEIQQRLREELGPSLARLDIKLDGAGYLLGSEGEAIRIAVNGVLFNGPVSTLIWVEPGTHTVTIRSAEYSAQPVRISVKKEQIARVKFALVRKAGAGSQPLRSDASPQDDGADVGRRPGRGYRIALWPALGIAGASLGVALFNHSRIGGFEQDKLDAIDDLQRNSSIVLDEEDACADAATQEATASENLEQLGAVVSACDSGKLAADLANVFYGVAAVSAAVSAFLVYQGYIAAPRAGVPGRAAYIRPSITPSVVGAELILRF
ncbi:MAG: tetratricopeptide repeat protein [Myxococcota bacterium]